MTIIGARGRRLRLAIHYVRFLFGSGKPVRRSISHAVVAWYRPHLGAGGRRSRPALHSQHHEWIIRPAWCHWRGGSARVAIGDRLVLGQLAGGRHLGGRALLGDHPPGILDGQEPHARGGGQSTGSNWAGVWPTP